MLKRLVSRMLGMFQSRTQVGVDKAGNHYFTRVEEVDGVMKEKRWVEFKGDQEQTIVPVEWICWLNGQRKKAPTPGDASRVMHEIGALKLTEFLKELMQRRNIPFELRYTVRTIKELGGL